MLRGIRGAITSPNTKQDILNNTSLLLRTMIQKNKINSEDIASIFFSSTKNLYAEFPAKAARILGYNDIPLLCLNEIDVEHSLQNCIRILIHWNTNKSQKEIHHVYLKEATILRPDL